MGSQVAVDDRVEGWHGDGIGKGAWYPGTVVCVHRDGTFDIKYDDGEDAENQILAAEPHCVRACNVGYSLHRPPPLLSPSLLSLQVVLPPERLQGATEHILGIADRIDARKQRQVQNEAIRTPPPLLSPPLLPTAATLTAATLATASLATGRQEA